MTNKPSYLKLNDQKFETINHSILFVPIAIGVGISSLESKNKIYGS